MIDSHSMHTEQETNARKRVFTGLLLTSTLFIMIIFSGPFLIFMLLVPPVIIALEWSLMTSPVKDIGDKNKYNAAEIAVFVIAVALVVFLSLYQAFFEAIISFLCCLGILSFLGFLQPTKALKRRFYLWPLGLIYAAAPSIAAAILLYHFANGKYWLICIIALVFCGDMGAYYIGKKWGKTPLPLIGKISPAKSVEGVAGGTIFGSLGFAYFLYFSPLENWLALGAPLLSILAQAGDFLESFIKRRFNCKDSGYLLPGHGGMMDRLDGFTVLIPFLVVSLALLGWPTAS